MRTRGIVGGLALLAAVLRFPGALWPIRPDEAGFTLVARTWQPTADSVYGPFWVDRPPTLIALVKLSDAVGGPLFIRVVAAVGCALLVLAAAGCARSTARLVGSPDRADRCALWTALAAAAFAGNTNIDPAAAKGEILGLPLLMGAAWLTLRALERRAALPAFAAGLLAMGAVGLKQSAVGGLVFGGAVLIGAALTHRLGGRDLVRLGAAAAAGAAVPVLATVAWAVAAGVRLSELWYVVVGFRADAGRVIAAEPSASNTQRLHELLLLLVVTGLALVAAWFVLRLPGLVRRQPALAVAVLLALTADTAGLLLGGSFWKPYAFGPVPSVLLALTLLLAVPGRLRAVAPALCGLAAASTAVSVVLFLLHSPWVGTPPKEWWTGQAIAAAADPGDSLVVYGGRADVQFGAGLPTPYRFLWSLPMRTLDPDLAELRGVLDGPDAPTWFVAWVPLTSWDDLGERALGPALAERYTRHDTVCGRQVYLLDGQTRPHLSVDCERWPF